MTIAQAPTSTTQPVPPWRRWTAPGRLLTLSAAVMTLSALTPLSPLPAAAQNTPASPAPPGRFAGSSKFWRPDYVGTLRLRSSGSTTFTAIAEVELQRQPETFPGAGVLDFEMRGLITLTSPLETNRNGLRTLCQIQKPIVPVRIEHSGLRLYRGDEERPKNSYELRVFQEVPLGDCVSSDGRRFQRAHNVMEVNVDSSLMAIQGRPQEALPEAPQPLTPEEELVAQERTRAAEALVNDPASQRELEELVARAQREGRDITTAEAVAWAERLRRRGLMPQTIPSFTPRREAELRRLGAHRPIDTSHLRRAITLDHLEGEVTLQDAHGTSVFSWSLRRPPGAPPLRGF